MFAAALVIVLSVVLAGSTADAAPHGTATPVAISDVSDMPCRPLPQPSTQPDRMFAGLPGDLCQTLLYAPVCDVPTGNVFNGAAAGATVVAVPAGFFSRLADVRGWSDVPRALQRYDTVILSEEMCELAQRDVFFETDPDVREDVAIAHLTLIHELAHIVDYRSGYSLSARLEHADIERGLGHAHGAHEFQELFAFCLTTLTWRTNVTLPAIEASLFRDMSRGRVNGVAGWRCPSDNREAVAEILDSFALTPAAAYFPATISI